MRDNRKSAYCECIKLNIRNMRTIVIKDSMLRDNSIAGCYEEMSKEERILQKAMNK